MNANSANKNAVTEKGTKFCAPPPLPDINFKKPFFKAERKNLKAFFKD
jgi:hypothetical protein